MIDKSSRTVEVSQSDTKNNIKGEREYSPVTSMSFHQSEVVYHQLLLPHKLHGYFHPAEAITVQQSELTVTSTLKAIEVLINHKRKNKVPALRGHHHIEIVHSLQLLNHSFAFCSYHVQSLQFQSTTQCRQNSECLTLL